MSADGDAEQVAFLMERLLDEQDENARLNKRLRELEAHSAVASARQRQWPSFNFLQLLLERKRILGVLREVETHLSDAAVRECAQFVPETLQAEVARQREEKCRVVRSAFRRLRGWCFVVGSPSDIEDISLIVSEVASEPAAFLKSFQFLRAACNNFNPAPTDAKSFVSSLSDIEGVMVFRALQAVIVGFDADADGLLEKHMDALLDVARNEPFFASLASIFTSQGGDPLIADELLPSSVAHVAQSTERALEYGARTSHAVGTPRQRRPAPSPKPAERRPSRAPIATPKRENEARKISASSLRRTTSSSSGSKVEATHADATADEAAWSRLINNAQRVVRPVVAKSGTPVQSAMKPKARPSSADARRVRLNCEGA
jgi:hypothetical protein